MKALLALLLATVAGCSVATPGEPMPADPECTRVTAMDSWCGTNSVMASAYSCPVHVINPDCDAPANQGDGRGTQGWCCRE